MDYEVRLKKIERLVTAAFGRRHVGPDEMRLARQVIESREMDDLCEETAISADYLRRLLHEHIEASRKRRELLGIRRVK